MINFFPFRACIDKSGILTDFPNENSRIQNIVSYFLSDAFRKSSGYISEDIIYYLCLDQNTVLFRINSNMKLTGMYFEENEIINSWTNISALIIYLFSTSYETACDKNSAEFSEKSFLPEHISAASYIIDPIEKKYRNQFIPISFVAGKNADIFYQHDINDIDYPVSGDISCFYDKNHNNQKICIPHIGETETASNIDDIIIYYRTPEKKRKGLMQFFKGNKEQQSDFLNNLFVKTDNGDVMLNKITQPCLAADEPGSFLFRFDKIVYASGGSQ